MPKNRARKERLEKLQDRLADHPHGRALLDFAQDIKISIHFKDDMPHDLFGRTDDKNAQIHLNALHDDHILVSILYHELRHAKQHHEGLFLHSGLNDGQIFHWPIRDPWAFFVLNRVAEGDAYARQAEFAFEHDIPVQEAMARHCAPVFNAYAQARKDNPQDRETALLSAFATFTKTTADGYDRSCLDLLDERLRRYESFAEKNPDLARDFFNVAGKFPLSSGIIREYAKLDPTANYLAIVPDEALNALGHLRPEMAAELTALEKRYNNFFAKFAGPMP